MPFVERRAVHLELISDLLAGLWWCPRAFAWGIEKVEAGEGVRPGGVEVGDRGIEELGEGEAFAAGWRG